MLTAILKNKASVVVCWGCYNKLGDLIQQKFILLQRVGVQNQDFGSSSEGSRR